MGRLRSPHNSMTAPTKSLISNTSAISIKSAPLGQQINTKWSPDYHITQKIPPGVPQKSKNNIPNPKKFNNSVKKVYLKPKVGKAFGNPSSPIKQFRSASVGATPSEQLGPEMRFGASEGTLKGQASQDKLQTMTGKKIIPLKNVKFGATGKSQDLSKTQTSDKYATLPKPPLGKNRNQQFAATAQNSVCGHDEISSEAILKMADESIATIDRQLLGTHSLPQRSSFIPSTNHIQPSLNQFSDQDAFSNNAENIKNSKIKSNFNLSFNNSFNTSFAGGAATKT